MDPESLSPPAIGKVNNILSPFKNPMSMAHLNDGVIAGKLRGILGKEIVFRYWEGMTIVAKAPKARLGDPPPDPCHPSPP